MIVSSGEPKKPETTQLALNHDQSLGGFVIKGEYSVQQRNSAVENERQFDTDGLVKMSSAQGQSTPKGLPQDPKAVRFDSLIMSEKQDGLAYRQITSSMPFLKVNEAVTVTAGSNEGRTLGTKGVS